MFKATLVVDEVELEIVKLALRAHQHTTENECADMMEDGNADPKNPEWNNACEWADRSKALYERVRKMEAVATECGCGGPLNHKGSCDNWMSEVNQ